MSWYDSTIIGVIVGGIIGFGSASLRDYLGNRRLVKHLKIGIKAEISVLKDFLETAHGNIAKYKEDLNQIDRNGKIPKYENYWFPQKTVKALRLYEPTGDFQFVFLDNNIGKIGALKNLWLEPIIELMGIAKITGKNLKTVFDTAKNVRTGEASPLFHLNQVSMALSTFEHMIKLCDKIINLN